VDLRKKADRLNLDGLNWVPVGVLSYPRRTVRSGQVSDFDFMVFTKTPETAELFQFSPAEPVGVV
jgi:hypothetical protein